MIKYWTPSELKTLRRLREGFLSGTAGNANYWRAVEDLALYDTTFAERIGWKWDGALRELTLRQWSPKSRHILDWGCGTGIASRRVLEWWPGQFRSLSLHDRSSAAMRFAAERAHRENPKLIVRMGEQMEPDTLLVLSHVINELPPRDLSRLMERAREAREIIWVEAGARDESRRLSEVRDRLLGDARGFVAVAPCTHQARCGMLTAKNEQHWCHHFAHPPSEIFQSASWHQFSLELGIDLRSLPYSFLVLQKSDELAPTAPDFSRVIGKPREFKGHD
ncbi:MAG: hypothetical protein JWL90_1001, partial [Chthoniobacteraceae bacterium]|nr:hypothetical protein [Chthoniobacteraceae bacterium]